MKLVFKDWQSDFRQKMSMSEQKGICLSWDIKWIADISKSFQD